ncbi:MAG: chromate efflux transporter, partial [Chloroflexi bacterium]|nr:chromate efflux transporter [Chloroflexota bacterium]
MAEGASPAIVRGSFGEVLLAASRLGISSFGGPIAHLGYFRDEYVLRRRWLDETTYADLIALFQFLPGPTSSQLGISIGILRAGKRGGLAAWLGFTLPSAVALTLFALGLQRLDLISAPWVHGLQLVAVAVVAQAVWGMARQFLTDRLRIAIGIVTTLVLLFGPSSEAQVAVIVVAGLVGWRLLPPATTGLHPHVGVPISRRFGAAAWIVFVGLLVGLPVLGHFLDSSPDGALALVQGFYRSGALVFGGGHVVLPLLQAVVVPPGWMSNSEFLAGYGAAQAVPGPLFTFSAFLGAARTPWPNGVPGAATALAAIFLPGALLVYASLPFWSTFRQHPAFQRALSGINASVVGILLAALYLTIWTQAVHRASDFGVVLVAFALLTVWKRPPWQVVVAGAAA